MNVYLCSTFIVAISVSLCKTFHSFLNVYTQHCPYVRSFSMYSKHRLFVIEYVESISRFYVLLYMYTYITYFCFVRLEYVYMYSSIALRRSLKRSKKLLVTISQVCLVVYVHLYRYIQGRST